MIPPEQTYLDLVGPEGHAKALTSFNAIVQEPNEHVQSGARTLFFLILLNAFYRGQNVGLGQARSALATVSKNARGEKSA